MEYIWETILEQNEKFFFRQAELFCPYSEVIEEYHNQESVEKQIVEYNSMLRFDKIFGKMLGLEKEEGEWTKSFFDACTHLLINVDSLEGLSQKELRIRKFMTDIENGICLSNIREDYIMLDKKKQYEVASLYVVQEEIGESVLYYAKSVTHILETGVVYTNRIKPREILVYLGEKMTEQMRILWNLVNYLFLPISYEVRLFENTHIGIINEEQTMQYEKLELF